jgi:uncharacterized protein (DUF2267 family)
MASFPGREDESLVYGRKGVAMESQENALSKEELLKRIVSQKVLPREVDAEKAASAVLCTFAAHLTRGEALLLVNSLSESLRPLLERAATRRVEHPLRFDSDQFFRIVGERLRITPEQAEVLAIAVLEEIREFIPGELFWHIDSQLPKDLKNVWRSAL